MSGTEGWYNEDIEIIREREYPMLKDATYLDHAATTLYAKSLIDQFATSMTNGLYGNPHSGSASSLLSSKTIDNVRLKALRFLKADPEEFDLVFVANATAATKLVADGFRAGEGGFSYLYHRDSHTSLVGVRECATRANCFESDRAVGQWLRSNDEVQDGARDPPAPTLFSYPAQSNMNGRRLPLSWTREVRDNKPNTYTLLDAAALVSTAQLDLSNPQIAPDFTVLSFYKIFGFPDLGALVVRKSSGHMLTARKYFGGGTVETVSCIQEQWHISRDQSIHQQLEDGTLPFHSILALDGAFDVHSRLFGSMDQISKHTSFLSGKLYQKLSSLKHFNGRPVCKIYTDRTSSSDTIQQGPIIALNIQDSNGDWVANSEVEKIASIKNIHLRIGGLCNPGGVAHQLNLTPHDLKSNFAAGQRCGDNDLGVGGKPTGVIRISLGAMSNLTDVVTFIDFVQEFFVEQEDSCQSTNAEDTAPEITPLFVESLTVYPIKSCSGWSVPEDVAWRVKKEGLEFDREWCLVHAGTERTLTQKRYPRMALLKPNIDIKAGLLRVHLRENGIDLSEPISVPLDASSSDFKARSSELCGSSISVTPYTSLQISDFFSTALGVPCNLARFPTTSGQGTRHAKPHLSKPQVPRKRQIDEDALSVPGSFPTPPPSPNANASSGLLSNESPMLCITRPSLDSLNSRLIEKGSKPVHHAVFRANVVIASSTPSALPYMEDDWTNLTIGDSGSSFEMLGKCQRCSMVCVNQETAEKSQEPFVTLAKTRRFDNKVYFGEHMCLAAGNKGKVFIKSGDKVDAFVAPPAVN